MEQKQLRTVVPVTGDMSATKESKSVSRQTSWRDIFSTDCVHFLFLSPFSAIFAVFSFFFSLLPHCLLVCCPPSVFPPLFVYGLSSSVFRFWFLLSSCLSASLKLI
ncbi:unnamed protein product [Pylaiella littoralis]